MPRVDHLSGLGVILTIQWGKTCGVSWFTSVLDFDVATEAASSGHLGEKKTYEVAKYLQSWRYRVFFESERVVYSVCSDLLLPISTLDVAELSWKVEGSKDCSVSM